MPQTAAKPSPATRRYEWREGIGHHMAMAMLAVRREVNRRMACHGLTEAQWKPMWLLATHRADTALGMAREMDVDAGAMTRTLDRLVAKGLLDRVRSDVDRRVVHLRFTPAGEQAASHIPVVLEAVNREMLQGFSLDDIQQLKSLLGRVGQNLQTFNTSPPGSDDAP